MVDSIEVLAPTGGSEQARVVAHGHLSDGCTSLAGDTVARQAQTIVVTLSTTRQPGAACAAAGQSYQQEIALNVAGLLAGEYVVVVNGVTGSLTLGAATVAQSLSTATPQASPTPGSATATAAPTQPPTAVATTVALTPAPTTTGAGQPSNCVDKAAFYGDVTIPDDSPFKQGEKFTKTWKVRNEGTCTWQGYTLVFAGGDNMSAPLSTPISPAAPEAIIEISLALLAPTRGGPQIGNWELQDAQGARFGVGASGQGPLWVKISVAYSGQENVATPSAGNSCGATRNSAYETQVLSLINAQRAAASLSTVSPQPQLAAAAEQHSLDMACNDFISHAGTDGSSWKNRVAAQGYANYNSAREIIYAGDVTFGADPGGAVDWWMNSPVHHDIVLYPTVTELGIACALSPNKPNWGYYTVVFARP
jgi:uncharacterized protein YkwD